MGHALYMPFRLCPILGHDMLGSQTQPCYALSMDVLAGLVMGSDSMWEPIFPT